MSARGPSDGSASSGQAVGLFRAMIEAFNERGTNAWLRLCSDDLVLMTIPEFPGGGRFEGKPAVRAFMNEFTEAWELARLETDDERELEGGVLSRARWRVRGRSSGADTTLDFFIVSRFEGGLLSSMFLGSTADDAIAADAAR